MRNLVVKGYRTNDKKEQKRKRPTPTMYPHNPTCSPEIYLVTDFVKQRADKRAFEIVRLSTEELDTPETPAEDNRSEISKYLSKIGRAGSLKGGKARAEKLSSSQRRMIAVEAAHV